MSDKPFAYVCSPYRGDIEANVERARGYCREIFEAGYTPLAPHLLFPQFLTDSIPREREAGMEMAAALLPLCRVLTVCGGDITGGMAREIRLAEELGVPILTLDVLLPENTRERLLAASPSVLEQIAAARADRTAVPNKMPPEKHKPRRPEL